VAGLAITHPEFFSLFYDIQCYPIMPAGIGINNIRKRESMRIPPKPTRSKGFVFLFGLCLSGIVLSSVWFLQNSYRQNMADAERNNSNLARMLEARFAETFARVAQLLTQQAQVIEVKLLPSGAKGEDLVSSFSALADAILRQDIAQIRYYAGDGRLRYATDPEHAEHSISDESYFHELRFQPALEFAFSEAMFEPKSGRWFLIMARAIRDSGGGLRAVVAGLIDLQQQAELLQKLDFGTSGLVSVRRLDDSRLILRIPWLDDEINHSVATDNAIRHFIVQGRKSGALVVASQIDGNERILHFRAIDRFPYYIKVGTLKSVALAAWYSQFKWTLLLQSVFIVLFGLGVRRLQRAMREQTRLTQAFNEQASQYRLAIQTSLDGFWLVDADGRILEVNDAYCAMSGYSREELLRKQVLDIDADQSAEVVAEHMATLKRCGFEKFETLHRAKSGRIVPVEIVVSFLPYAGGRFYAFIKDLSQQKQDKARLEENRARLSAIIDNEPECIEVIGVDGCWADINPAGVGMYEADCAEQLIACSVFDFIAPAFRLAYADLHRRVIDGESCVMEYAVNGRKAGRRWLETHAVPMRQNGETFHLAITRDVTERRKLEQVLRESHERMFQFFELAPVGIAMSDMQGRLVEFNLAFQTISGRSARALAGLSYNDITPERLQVHDEAQFEILQRTGTYGPYEKELERPNGELVTVRVNGMRVTETDGNLYAWSIFEDITHLKLGQQLLRASEQRFQAVVDALPIGILIVDERQNVNYLNPSFIATFGYSTRDIANIADWWRVALPEAEYREWVIDNWSERQLAAQRQGQFSPLEIRLSCKNGSRKRAIASAVPLADLRAGRLQLITLVDVTEMKRLEIKLRESYEQLNKLSQNVPGAIFQYQRHQDGWDRFPYASKGMAELFGIAADKLLSDAKPWLEAVHPDDRKSVEESLAYSAESLSDWKLEYRVPAADGSDKWLLGQARPERLADGSVLWNGYFGDISDRKRLNRKLEENQALMTAVLENVSAYIYLKDQNFRYVYANRMARALFQANAVEVIGSSDFDMFDAQTAAKIRANDERILLKGETIQVEHEYRLKEGELTKVFLTVKLPLRREDGTIYMVCGISTDITSRVELENSIRAARDAAEQSALAKSQFLTNMSHEIRTPMSGVIGLTALALNQHCSMPVRQYLEKIASSSQSLLGILNDILDIAKMEAGRLTLEREPFDLDVELDILRAMFEDKALAKQLRFAIDVAAGTPRELVGDALRLRQVLSNLLSNALKFTPQGSVKLAIACERQSDDTVDLNFSVSDTGIGINATDLDKLFQPFSQVDSSIARRFGGTGLGLAISRNLLQLMGSDFYVTSAQTEGSTFGFVLRLPLATKQTRITRRRRARKAGALTRELQSLGAPIRGARILLVEDDEINQRVVAEFLKLTGLAVSIAGNGADALATLQQTRFDAVLMDVNMPEMDGFEVCRRIRSQPQYAALPIIALSAGASESERAHCIDQGMNDFAAKPVDPNQLIHTLTRWVAHRSPADSPLETAVGEVLDHSTSALLSPDNHAAAWPGLDCSRLLDMLGGDRAFLLELLWSFKASSQDVMDKIAASVESADFKAATELLHELKGTAGNLGAYGLQGVCAHLEAACRQEACNSSSLAELESVYCHTIAEIDRMSEH